MNLEHDDSLKNILRFVFTDAIGPHIYIQANGCCCILHQEEYVHHNLPLNIAVSTHIQAVEQTFELSY